MSDYQFSPDLDDRLRDFIAHPGNFVAELGLVHALHVYPVVAVADQSVVPIDEDKQVIPVFTTSEALAAFQKTISDPLTFTNRTFFEVVNDLLTQEFDALGFNLSATEPDTGNTILLPREDLVAFLNYYTDVLNKLMGAENASESLTSRYFLIPAFVRTTPEGETVRLFATLSKPSGEAFVPVFSHILSFAKWYNHPDFGRPFQEHGGLVLVWRVTDLREPETGRNDLADVLGIAIDPFDAVDYDKSVILWEDLVE